MVDRWAERVLSTHLAVPGRCCNVALIGLLGISLADGRVGVELARAVLGGRLKGGDGQEGRAEGERGPGDRAPALACGR